MKLIDAHLHLDLYENHDRDGVVADLLNGAESVVAVSMHLRSCIENLRLAGRFPGRIHPAFGYHPEQPLPDEAETERLFAWLEKHLEDAAAVGEVGLPYYARVEAERSGSRFELVPYVELLERFVRLAAERGKPIVLHAVYDDAPIVCDLLETYNLRNAHFHWFKGDSRTLARMAANGWHISITPDVAYEAEIREMVKRYPIGLMMAETDGPWPFAGKYAGRMTRPAMVRDVIAAIAALKGLPADGAAERIYTNTKRFYRLDERRTKST